MVGPEGMEKFCEDIGVEPENVRRFKCILDIYTSLAVWSPFAFFLLAVSRLLAASPTKQVLLKHCFGCFSVFDM